MTCKGRFIVNFHTNEVVGVAHDCLKTNVICKELGEVQKYDSNDDGSTEKEPVPELAKHFIVLSARCGCLIVDSSSLAP
eukprot:2714989-Ditylum_brightwellii.AAC.1